MESSPDVSLIEASVSAAIVVSDESSEEMSACSSADSFCTARGVQTEPGPPVMVHSGSCRSCTTNPCPPQASILKKCAGISPATAISPPRPCFKQLQRVPSPEPCPGYSGADTTHCPWCDLPICSRHSLHKCPGRHPESPLTRSKSTPNRVDVTTDTIKPVAQRRSASVTWEECLDDESVQTSEPQSPVASSSMGPCSVNGSGVLPCTPAACPAASTSLLPQECPSASTQPCGPGPCQAVSTGLSLKTCPAATPDKMPAKEKTPSKSSIWRSIHCYTKKCPERSPGSCSPGPCPAASSSKKLVECPAAQSKPSTPESPVQAPPLPGIEVEKRSPKPPTPEPPIHAPPVPRVKVEKRLPKPPLPGIEVKKRLPAAAQPSPRAKKGEMTLQDVVKKLEEEFTPARPIKTERELCCRHSEGSESSSKGGSGSGGVSECAAAQRYQAKLLATLQILQNKEETVRVQGESLAVAEARITTLTERVALMRQELERRARELRAVRAKVPVHMACGQTQTQEVEKQKHVVRTLQTNLSVIEDLYRECFYETAKQEELIEMLRKSYLDVRQMDKEKSDQIGSLQNVINTQKWSLDKCQDIAVEVENLKLEISNFINSSNNDSGMWERSEDSLVTEVGEDLQEIMEQLVELKGLLADDSQDENMKKMQKKMEELCQRACEAEAVLAERDVVIQQLRTRHDEMEAELLQARRQIEQLECRDTPLPHDLDTCQCRKAELVHAEGKLIEKTAELEEMREQSKTQEAKIAEMRSELLALHRQLKEKCSVRCEVSYLTNQVSRWRAQLADSEARVRTVEAELARARDHCRDVDVCYREKVSAVTALQEQLEVAHDRGAQLCGEARRVVCAVRHWLRGMRHTAREQERKIKEQEAMICMLQKRLQEANFPTSTCHQDALTECARRRQARDEETSCDQSAVTRCSKCARRLSPREQQRRVDAAAVPGSSRTPPPPPPRITDEVCGCSSNVAGHSNDTSCLCSTRRQESGGEAPVPPRRMFRRLQQACNERRCQDGGGRSPPGESGSCPQPACRHHRVHRLQLVDQPTLPHPRAASPGAELMERVEQLHVALEDGHRRWTRARPHPPCPR